MPKLPKAATKKTKKGLIAFAEYWYATVEFAYKTGDVAPIRDVSGEGCFACRKT
jgi:hypothetical protein